MTSDRVWQSAQEHLGATDAEVAAMQALHTSDYGDLIGLEYLFQVVHIALSAAVDTLPATEGEYQVWMREHQLGHGAAVGTVISAVRADLLRLAGG